MCKKLKGIHNRIDKCMVNLISLIKAKKGRVKTLACCCGHGKYPMTIVVTINGRLIWELMSGKRIPRKRNFYKKDKQEYYFIPEVIND